MDKLLETYNLPKLNQEESALNRQIATSEIEAVKKNLLINKSFGLMASQVHFTKHSKKDLTPILLKLFCKIQEEGGFKLIL